MTPDDFTVAGPWTNDSTDCLVLTCPRCRLDIADTDEPSTLAALRARAEAHIAAGCGE